MPRDFDPQSGQFHTTHWSLVLAAARAGSQQSAQALEQLCAGYWPPLYSYVRRCGHTIHAAQDLTQEFFTRLIDKQFLSSADQDRGRFRSFLLAALKHFLANERKAALAQKRGGGKVPLALDFQAAENAYQSELIDAETPEQFYERQWALLLLDRVLGRLESEFTSQERKRQFAELRRYLTAERDQVPYAEMADALQISEAAVKMAVHRLRKRYREILLAEIGQTVDDPADTEDELRQLFRAIGGG